MSGPAPTGRTVTVVLVCLVALIGGWVLWAVAAPSETPEPLGSPVSPSSSTQPTRSTTPSPSVTPTPKAPALLLPNVGSLGADSLQIERTGTGRLLRFDAALGNLGPGPLLLRPRGNRACPPRQHPATQVVYADRRRDGRYHPKVERRPRGGERHDVGCMRRHRGHGHWHFDGMARYRLRRAGSDDVVAQRRKVSFCLRDNRRVPGLRTRVRREHFGDCRRNSRQGISPGWVDVYEADLPGQTLELPRGIDGDHLCLDLEADPRDQLLETEDADNGTTMGLRIRGSTVRRAPTAPCRS